MGRPVGAVLLGLAFAGLAALLLTTPAVPLGRQPFPDPREYADSANNLTHGHGYTTTVPDSPGRPLGYNPPRYPPGFPLILAPFTLVGGYPDNVQLAVKVLAVALLVTCMWAAYSLGGVLAAVVALLLVGVTPFAVVSAKLVGSDAFAAIIPVALIPLVRSGSKRAVYAAGLLAGYGVLVRIPEVIVLAGLLVAPRGRDRLRVMVAAAPSMIALGVYQWLIFGAPWRTGYGFWLPDVQSLSLAYAFTSNGPGDAALFPDVLQGSLLGWMCFQCPAGTAISSLPPLLFYPAVLLGPLWVFSPPFVGLIGAVEAAVRGHTAVGRLVLTITLGYVLVFSVYFFRSARFMAPASLMLTVFAAVAIARGLRRVAAKARGRLVATA